MPRKPPTRKLDASNPSLAFARLEAKRAKADHLTDDELAGIATVAWFPVVAEAKGPGFDLDRVVFRPQNLLVAAYWHAYTRDPEATLRLLTRLRKRLREFAEADVQEVEAIRTAVAELPDEPRERQTQRAAELLGIREPSMPRVDSLKGAAGQRASHESAMKKYRQRMTSLRKRLESHLRLGVPNDSFHWFFMG